MKKYINKITLFFVFATLIVSCTVEEFNDLNGPEVSGFENGITPGDLRELVGGIFYSSRVSLGTYFDDVGVIGREYYRFASSDPRFTSDLLGRENAVLDNNTFYITNPWAGRYRTVKNANLILGFLENPETISQFTAQELNATKGFLKTFIAYELLLNLNLVDDNGIRIDVKDEFDLGPFVSKSEALTAIKSILDEATGNLASGGDEFPFPLTTGFGNFNTPNKFIKFTKAISARVSIYQGNYTEVLANLNDSFFELNGALNTGAYHVFSLDQTDIANPMFFALNSSTAGARIVQPNFITDAEAGDTRLSKVVLRNEPLTLDGLTGDYDVFIYQSNTDPIPIIRNEELILLYAEANIFSNPGAAVTALNIIRNSAGLAPYAGGMDQASLIQEMLTQRRYSLYAEGHRWIDVRRYNLLNTLPIDRVGDDVFSKFPIPLTENQ
ncbi:MAG: RagB/SusD family nutrient uptake outer membrane protein [Flavobacteriaceae bacterium CG_4_8_14_3_um_filter_34_10]|nr:MAG: RagB/SusD family nutrient uptake outer membrane protein [Flavobacteriaceae bacterium CG2_30_34_30]PIX09914.1 MAG: RagB/SusD family nutrient uptake outer membrane protein [Flavobacteriaceae bacterium CG_4_8_14_3_um_filter_34_10]